MVVQCISQVEPMIAEDFLVEECKVSIKDNKNKTKFKKIIGGSNKVMSRYKRAPSSHII